MSTIFLHVNTIIIIIIIIIIIVILASISNF